MTQLQIFTRLPVLLKRNVSVIVCRTFCAACESNRIGANKQAVYKWDINNRSVTPVWQKEAERFMLTLDEEALQRKNELEILIEILKQEDEYVPDVISPLDWKILITECLGYYSRVKYLQYLYDKKIKIVCWKHQKELERQEILNKRTERTYVYGGDRKKLRKWWKGLESVKSDIPVVVDLDFETDVRRQRVEYEQMTSVWNCNLNHLQPLDLHFTSVHKNFRMKAIFEGDSKMYRVLNFHKEHFLEIFPREDVVYLTPDGPPMYEFNPDCTYVLGGIEDSTPHLSVGVARKLGIRFASFPITAYYKLAPSSSMTLHLSIAYRILLDMYLTNSWLEAFSKNLPESRFILLEEGSRQWDMGEQSDALNSKKCMPVSAKVLNILNNKSK